MNKNSTESLLGPTTQPQKVRNRLIVTFVVLLVGAMLVATMSLFWLRLNDIQSRVIDETLVKANLVAKMIAPSLEFGESNHAQEILAYFSSDPSVSSIQIKNLDGENFATFGNSKISPGLQQKQNWILDSEGLWVRASVKIDGNPAGSVLLQASLNELQREVQRSLLTSIPIMAGIVLLTVLLMLKALLVITRPIQSLAETAAEITAKGDLSLRAAKLAEDEVGLLTDEFNMMLDKLEKQNKSIELEKQNGRHATSERLESLGLLAGGVAHDLNNILGPMVAMPDIILRKLERNHAARNDIMMISKASRRAAVVIQDLLSLARRGTYDLVAIDLNEIVRDCIASPAVQQRLGETPGSSIELKLDASLEVAKGSEPHLIQLVLNLAINAIEAMSDWKSDGKIVIRTKNVLLRQPHDAYETIPAGEYTMLSITDEGPGMSKDAMKHIFEPFYTSKKLGSSGSGLGLSVVYGVVRDHGGFLDVISKPGHGAEFRVYLHKNDTVKFAEDADSVIEMDARILVVDDMETQRYLTESLLESIGYRSFSATNGRQAIEILHADPDIDLMIVDMIMEDGFDGFDTIREALRIKPTLPCIIATGYSETDRVKSAMKLGAHACLTKPYTVELLSKVVNRALKSQLRKSGIPIETRPQETDANVFERIFPADQPQSKEPVANKAVDVKAPQRQVSEAVANTVNAVSAPQPQAPVTGVAAGSGKKTILVVDDDPDIREIAMASISELNLNVVGAKNAVEVLKWLETASVAPNLVLTDMDLPGGITGLDIVRKVQQEHPHCKAILMSGHSAADIQIHQQAIRGLEFIAKPFSLPDLNQKVQTTLSRASLSPFFTTENRLHN